MAHFLRAKKHLLSFDLAILNKQPTSHLLFDVSMSQSRLGILQNTEPQFARPFDNHFLYLV